MNRRDFICTSAGTALLGTLASFNSNAFTILKPDRFIADYHFFDERFLKAVRHVRSTPSRKTVAVRGDVTQLWMSDFKTHCQQRDLLLTGVTTESFYFCLNIMLQSHVGVETSVKRIDQDLYAWSIQINNKNKT